MNSTERAGNHIRIKIPGWKEGDTEESVQVYYTNVTPNGSRFDVTSFTNGDLYIGGWGAIPEEIPELASSVHAQPSEIKDMLEFVKKYVKVDTRHELEYYDAGRCYRPTAIPKRPIITKVDWDLLGHERHSDTSSASISQERHVTVGGLIINTAHGSDGITLGPGSGRLASELVLGLTPSVDISSLGIPESSHL
jgi:glycine/D-amino acid oxidase-like deaminating enzyme